MGSVTLSEVWIHDASDLSSYVTALLAGETVSTSIEGEVRRYAGGRLRSVTRPGAQHGIPISLELLSRATVDQLEEWVGRTVMIRDTRGRKYWGVYFRLEVEELAGVAEDVSNVSFTFEQISHDEEV